MENPIHILHLNTKRDNHERKPPKTAIIVAHRLSTLKAMDKIMVLENGHIVELRTHSELLVQKGAYYNYWTHQSSGFIK